VTLGGARSVTRGCTLFLLSQHCYATDSNGT